MFTEEECRQMHHGKQPTEFSIAAKIANNRFPVGTVLVRKIAGKDFTNGLRYRVERRVAGVSAVVNDEGELRVITKTELALGHWEKD